MQIITEADSFPIQPKDINTERHFFNTFGKCERETSALVCVSLAQKHGSWRPFTKKEIDKHWNEDVWFNDLDTQGWIVKKGGKYYFTKEFIAKCFASSPA